MKKVVIVISNCSTELQDFPKNQVKKKLILCKLFFYLQILLFIFSKRKVYSKIFSENLKHWFCRIFMETIVFWFELYDTVIT